MFLSLGLGLYLMAKSIYGLVSGRHDAAGASQRRPSTGADRGGR